MGLLKGLFQKKESSCCEVKFVEVQEDTKAETKGDNEQKDSDCCASRTCC